jgi:hypothetical protein
VPYDLSPEFVEELFTKHKIDYIIHGDDPCLLPDGSDAYAHAKKLGRFKMVRRGWVVCVCCGGCQRCQQPWLCVVVTACRDFDACGCCAQRVPTRPCFTTNTHTQIKRTEGVSTTDIVGRMLTCTRVNPYVTQELDSQVCARLSLGCCALPPCAATAQRER